MQRGMVEEGVVKRWEGWVEGTELQGERKYVLSLYPSVENLAI